MNEFASLVRRLELSARRAPDDIAVVHGNRRVSYGELWTNVGAVAGFLRSRGVQTGDRVAILLENSPEYIAAYYGSLAAGAVAVGLNSAARARELACWLEHCGARWLIADTRHSDFGRLSEIAGQQIIGVGAYSDAAFTPWGEVITAAPAVPVDVTESTAAAIIYTSGTTGRPKGVALTHGNFSANTAAILAYLQLRRSDRVLNLLPFFYSYGASVLHTHLAAGGMLVLENHLVYPQRILDRMAEAQVTGFPGVPSTFALLLQSGDLRKFDLGSLRYMTQAGGAMPAQSICRLREQLPHVRFFVMYGQTEATARLTYLAPERLLDKLGSVGVPLAGVELEIRGEDGRALPHGESGEVCVRGPNVMAGYYKDADATMGVLRDGWLHTGDLGHLDTDGYLFLQGRRSDMIKSGAHRISPLDIEDVIAGLPEVAEVAVVGVPDSVLGEAIKAVVTLRPGAALDAMSIQRHCIQQLPRYKVPKAVEFVDRLPRTSSGKIMRYRLARTETDYDHTVRTA
jgi:acyl-CoA synthetase (AMP-forming)/AMP-acid ligase II